MPDVSQKISPPPRLRPPTDPGRRREARLPFLRLVAHFLARLVRGGHETESADFDFGAGPLLGLLAAPGAFCALVLFDKYSTLQDFILQRRHPNVDAMSAPDKYFFICLAMAVAGIVTAIKWDKILPDAQDYLNLAPLPVRPRKILLANAAAIAFAVIVFAIDVNGASTVVFPAIVVSYSHQGIGAIALFAAAHAVTLILASLFTFCSIFALLGVLTVVMPREAFRACSAWVRGAVLIASTMLLLTSGAGPALLRGLAKSPGSPARFLPPLWYFGLYQTLQGRATPLLAQLAHTALAAFAAAFALMVATYALTYRRSFAAILESGRTRSRQRLVTAVLRFLDVFAWRAPAFERACHRFVIRAMLRSESHRMCLAVAVGLGWLLAMEQWSSHVRLSQLAAPLTAAYLLVLGLRVAFEMPAGIAANWVFRAVLDPHINQALGAPRRVVLSFLVPTVLVPTLVLAWWQWGVWVATIHTLYVLALSLSLSELMLAGYRKIPLTCPMPGFRDNFLALCFIQIVGFALFTQFGAGLENWMLVKPWTFLLVPAAMGAGWFWNRRRIAEARAAGELDESLTFENVQAPAIERLDLFDAG
jgi:hypothetical protein